MQRNFTLEYWLDDGWYVGRLREVPGVFSQGETLAELEENIRDAYRLMKDDAPHIDLSHVETKEIGVEV
jgi:predicted RNase H-like HicB family nuclease